MTNPQPDEVEREIVASDYAYLLSVAKDLGYSAVLNALEDLSRLREQVATKDRALVAEVEVIELHADTLLDEVAMQGKHRMVVEDIKRRCKTLRTQSTLEGATR